MLVYSVWVCGFAGFLCFGVSNLVFGFAVACAAFAVFLGIAFSCGVGIICVFGDLVEFPGSGWSFPRLYCVYF